jgi:hypothetical protein
LRREISISLTLSAAVLMLLTSPLLLFNLLQPIQAQTAMSFKTPTPASGTMSVSPIEGEEVTLTFDVHGTRLVNSEKLDTNGAYQITSKHDGKILYSGSLPAVQGCCLTNDSSAGKPIHLLGDPIGAGISISTSCSTLATNHIDVLRLGPGPTDIAHFQGPVECSPQGGNATQQSSSSSMTGTTTQDGDGDGILDANDNCPNLSHTRCYKEGDTAVVVHNSNR